MSAGTAAGDYADGRSGAFSFDLDFSFPIGNPIPTRAIVLPSSTIYATPFSVTIPGFAPIGFSIVAQSSACYPNPPYPITPAVWIQFPGGVVAPADIIACRYAYDGISSTRPVVLSVNNDTVSGHIHFEYGLWKGFKRGVDGETGAQSSGEIMGNSILAYYDAIPAGTPWRATVVIQSATTGDIVHMSASGTMPYTEFYPSPPPIQAKGRKDVNIQASVPGFAVPGSLSLTNIQHEDGHGWGVTFAASDGIGSLTVSDHALTLSGTLAPYTPSCQVIAGAKTLVDIDALTCSMYDANYPVDTVYVLPFSTPTTVPYPPGGSSRWKKTAPLGVWSESNIDVTHQQVFYNDSVATMTIPGFVEFFAGIEDAFAARENLTLNANATDAITLYDDVCWGVSTVRHASSVSIDTFGSITGWTAANATLALSGGLQITATATIGSASRTTYATDFRNFRTAKVRLACNGAAVGRTILVSFVDNGPGLASHTYAVTLTATAATDYSIDLLFPIAGFAGSSDNTDSSWYLPPGALFGPTAVTQITFDGLHSGDVVTCSSISLVRAAATKGWILPEGMPSYPWPYVDTHDSAQGQGWHRSNPSASGYPMYARLMRAICDGRPTMDLYHAKRASTVGTNFLIEATERISLADWYTAMNAQVGISADALVDVSSPILSSPATNFYSGRMFAAYLTLDAPGARAAWGQDFSAKAVNAWPQFKKIRVVPGYRPAGGGNLILRWTKRLWGRIMGTLPGPDGTGKSVSIVGGASPAETITTDANGFFISGSRRLNFLDASSAAIQTIHTGADGMRLTGSARMISWGAFVPHPASPSDVCVGVSLSGHLYKAIAKGGNVAFKLAYRPYPPYDVQTLVTNAGTDSLPAVIMTSKNLIWILFARLTSGVYNVYESSSADYGQSWSSETMAFAGGTSSCNLELHDQAIFRAALVSGNIQAQLIGKDGTLGTGFTFKDTSGTALAIAAGTRFDVTQTQDGLLWLICTINAETDPSDWYSADGGAHWTRF